MITEEIRNALYTMQDEKYRDFQGSLIPGNETDIMIGVRTPLLRSYAKELAEREDIQDFLNDLPHRCFEENQLHAFIIAGMKDFGQCIKETERFLPYVNNWATCDQMNPTVFRKQRQEISEYAQKWMQSRHTYTIRFGIKVFMDHFLDEAFELRQAEKIAALNSDEYYVQMMQAWYFATALAKHYDAVLPFLEEHRLPESVHTKTIRKALESYRVTEEHKQVLRRLR
ncbi:MAG: DNA alkylation repair protein [Solobacterium sp.]|nr:DNA alkylation repair protein [Solobacterium sp.]